MSDEIQPYSIRLENCLLQVQDSLSSKSLEKDSEKLSKLVLCKGYLKQANNLLNEIENDLYKDYKPVLEYIIIGCKRDINRTISFKELVETFKLNSKPLKYYLDSLVYKNILYYDSVKKGYYWDK